VEDSFTYAEADVETRLLIEARNEADTVLTHVGRALRQGANLVGDTERGAIEAAVAALRQARAGHDRDAIRERTTDLNHATERLAEAMMDAALKGALGTRRADEVMERGAARGGES
jgi:molecular chaperone DnaK (HSP70)